MSNSLDLDRARRFVETGLSPNCLPGLSADDTGSQRVKIYFLKITHIRIFTFFALGLQFNVEILTCMFNLAKMADYLFKMVIKSSNLRNKVQFINCMRKVDKQSKYCEINKMTKYSLLIKLQNTPFLFM